MIISYGQMLLLINEPLKGIKKINRPDKIYLNNTNLLYAYCQNSKKGTIRETFSANQVSQKSHLVISKQGDFTIDNKFRVEIGGKNKDFKQIKDIPNSFLALDDIKIGSRAKIPLWLFGFLY